MFSETRTTTLRTTVTETTHAVLALWSLAALATALAAVIALWKKARVRPAGALLFAAMLGAPLMVEYVILLVQSSRAEPRGAAVGIAGLGLLVLPIALIDAVRKQVGTGKPTRWLL